MLNCKNFFNHKFKNISNLKCKKRASMVVKFKNKKSCSPTNLKTQFRLNFVTILKCGNPEQLSWDWWNFNDDIINYCSLGRPCVCWVGGRERAWDTIPYDIHEGWYSQGTKNQKISDIWNQFVVPYMYVIRQLRTWLWFCECILLRAWCVSGVVKGVISVLQ